jgi:hypothetical protein
VDPGTSLVLAVDAATAAAALFNAAALSRRREREPSAARRNALLALGVLSAGVAVQAVFSQALYASQRAGADTTPFFAADAWVASKALLLAGTLLLTVLITRGATP